MNDHRVSSHRRFAWEPMLWVYLLLLPAALTLGWVALEVYRQTRLRGVPDIGHPFDVQASGWVDVDPAQNAKADYRGAAGWMVELGKPDDDTIHAVLEGGWVTADDGVRDWVEANRRALEIWRRGTEKPVYLRSQPAELTIARSSWKRRSDPGCRSSCCSQIVANREAPLENGRGRN